MEMRPPGRAAGKIADRGGRIEDVVQTAPVQDEVELVLQMRWNGAAQIGHDIGALVVADIEAVQLRIQEERIEGPIGDQRLPTGTACLVSISSDAGWERGSIPSSHRTSPTASSGVR